MLGAASAASGRHAARIVMAHATPLRGAVLIVPSQDDQTTAGLSGRRLSSHRHTAPTRSLGPWHFQHKPREPRQPLPGATIPVPGRCRRSDRPRPRGRSTAAPCRARCPTGAACSGVKSRLPTSCGGITRDSVLPRLAVSANNLQALAEAARRLAAMLQIEAHHRAGLAHLLACERGLRMPGQPRDNARAPRPDAPPGARRCAWRRASARGSARSRS